MDYTGGFEYETKITGYYDPNGTREPGFYSNEYKDKYIEWLEGKYAELNRERI